MARDPAIQLSYSIGDTSGRFEVARIVARVFPKYQGYVQHVIAEGRVAHSSSVFCSMSGVQDVGSALRVVVRASVVPHSCPRCEGMNGPPGDLW